MLSYCSDSIPGEDLQDKIEACRHMEVGIDLVLARHTPPIDETCDLTPSTIIAYECHHKNLLSNRSHRRRFLAYLDEWQQFSELPLVTALYEKDLDDDTAALEFYTQVARVWQGKILIEALGSRRTIFRPALSHMSQWVEELGRDRFGLVADTAHIWNEEGDGLYESLSRYGSHLDVIHLRGESGRPPGRSRLIDFKRVIQALQTVPDRLCVECSTFPNHAGFRGDVVWLRSLLENRLGRRDVGPSGPEEE